MVDKKRYSGKIIKQKYTDAYIKLISTAGLTYGVLRSSYEWLTGQYDNAEYRDGIVRIMPLPLWFPFDIESKAHYIGAICLETYNTILNCLHSVCQEVPLISISEELCSEFQILAKGIEIFDQRAAALYKILYGNITEGNQIDKKKFERCIQLCLRDSVRHHVILKRTYEDLMRLFKIPLALCIFSSALMLCFSGISFTDESVPINVKCIFFVILTVEIAYTFIFCWYGQKIQDSSSEIGEVIYKTNWYKYPESVKRYILIMQPCAQRPLKLTAAGFIDVELPTFLDVSKQHYFNITRTK
ncbi:hypothetical protein O3M35_011705 [Rhynocoris fuscipes]|uniref:Odorant receptor n=1 Tax=Rhynocoris fuscipes TaxID=488301 RepID=A0AAW1CW70_9HEMI